MLWKADMKNYWLKAYLAHNGPSLYEIALGELLARGRNRRNSIVSGKT
jgi:hypothetical protein